MATGKRNDKLIWGLIFIVLGVIFLFESLDYDVWDSVARLWPLILVVWGGWKLIYGLKEAREERAEPKSPQAKK